MDDSKQNHLTKCLKSYLTAKKYYDSDIEKLQKVNFQNFYNILYRIDLSEDQIKREMAASVDKTFSEVVTDLILKREMLKVVMRKNYSSRSNQ